MNLPRSLLILAAVAFCGGAQSSSPTSLRSATVGHSAPYLSPGIESKSFGLKQGMDANRHGLFRIIQDFQEELSVSPESARAHELFAQVRQARLCYLQSVDQWAASRWNRAHPTSDMRYAGVLDELNRSIREVDARLNKPGTPLRAKLALAEMVRAEERGPLGTELANERAYASQEYRCSDGAWPSRTWAAQVIAAADTSMLAQLNKARKFSASWGQR